MGSAVIIIVRDDKRSMKFVVFERVMEICGQVLLGSPAAKQERN